MGMRKGCFKPRNEQVQRPLSGKELDRFVNGGLRGGVTENKESHGKRPGHRNGQGLECVGRE